MLIPIHAEITLNALDNTFNPDVLKIVIRANKKQDAINGQIGHSEFHFDNNKIVESQNYLQYQREVVFLSIEQMDLNSAWAAFGRLIHTAQDMYAHSNYVTLWLDQFPDGEWPPVDKIDPLDELVLSNSQFRSGKLYYPFELLSFIPLIKKIIIPLLPRDSHAWMNLDSSASGEKFAYAFYAASKRTQLELEIIKEKVTAVEFEKFINGQVDG